MKLAEILTGPETWRQGRLWGPNNKKCLLGAWIHLINVMNFSEVEVRESRALLGELVEEGGFVVISQWNDAPKRTWDDVAELVGEFDRRWALREGA